MNIDKYLKELSAKTPVPGGGSAAALAAALGIALVTMVARYVSKKAKNKSAEKKISAITIFGEKALCRLKLLMREDEKAYLKLIKEMKKPQYGRLLELYKNAVRVPLEVCNIAQLAISESAELGRYCRTSIMSDIAEGALLLEAAFFSAKLNVEINLRGIKDAAYKRKIKNILRRAEKKTVEAKKTALLAAAVFMGT